MAETAYKPWSDYWRIRRSGVKPIELARLLEHIQSFGGEMLSGKQVVWQGMEVVESRGEKLTIPLPTNLVSDAPAPIPGELYDAAIGMGLYFIARERWPSFHPDYHYAPSPDRPRSRRRGKQREQEEAEWRKLNNAYQGAFFRNPTSFGARTRYLTETLDIFRFKNLAVTGGGKYIPGNVRNRYVSLFFRHLSQELGLDCSGLWRRIKEQPNAHDAITALGVVAYGELIPDDLPAPVSAFLLAALGELNQVVNATGPFDTPRLAVKLYVLYLADMPQKYQPPEPKQPERQEGIAGDETPEGTTKTEEQGEGEAEAEEAGEEQGAGETGETGEEGESEGSEEGGDVQEDEGEGTEEPEGEGTEASSGEEDDSASASEALEEGLDTGADGGTEEEDGGEPELGDGGEHEGDTEEGNAEAHEGSDSESAADTEDGSASETSPELILDPQQRIREAGDDSLDAETAEDVGEVVIQKVEDYSDEVESVLKRRSTVIVKDNGLEAEYLSEMAAGVSRYEKPIRDILNLHQQKLMEMEHNLRQGRLSGRALHRLTGSDTRIFKSRQLPRPPTLDLCMLVDWSGSMGFQYAFAASQPLTNQQRSQMVMLAIYRATQAHRNISCWAYGYHGGQQVELLRIVTPWEVSARLDSRPATGNTPSASALIAAGKELMARGRCDHRLIIHVTDGLPTEHLYEVTKALDFLGGQKVGVYCLGLLDDPTAIQQMEECYGKSFVLLHSMDELPGAVKEIVDSTLTRLERR